KDGKAFTLQLQSRARGEEPRTVEVKIGAKSAVAYFGVGPDGARPTRGYAAQVKLAKGGAGSGTFRGAAGPFRRGADFTPMVAGVSKDGKTITLDLPLGRRGEEAKRIEVKLTDRTTIAYHNVGPGGAKVAEGFRAAVWLKEGSKDTAERMGFAGKEQVERRGE